MKLLLKLKGKLRELLKLNYKGECIMSEKNIFKMAVEGKFRYPSNVGNVNTEDLYDLNVNQLDSVFKNLNKQLKKTEEESLLEIKSKEDSELDIKIEIVKVVVKEKLQAKKDALTEKENAEKKQRLLKLLKEKQDASLNDLSEDEIKKMISELE